jgi:hypothetical protein
LLPRSCLLSNSERLDTAGIKALGLIGAAFGFPFVLSENVEYIDFVESTCENMGEVKYQLLNAL